MNNIFKCPKCFSLIDTFHCSSCGYQVPQLEQIYQFTDEPSIQLDGDNKYIGYDNIGEDFEPASLYWGNGRDGIYTPCGDHIAEKFGTNITVLDLGAGLGTASIPLAKNGSYTIAADISNVMLSTAVKRANGRFDNLIFAKMNAYELMLEDNSVDIFVVMQCYI